MKEIQKVNLAVFLLLGAATFWGLNFHEAKIMLRYVNFIEAGFWRYLFGVAFLFLLQVRFLKHLSFKEIKKGWKGIVLVGFVGIFGFNVFFFWGLLYTSALNAALIIGLTPATTLIASRLMLKTPIYKRQKIGILIAFAGVVYLLSKGRPDQLLQLKWSVGDLLIMIANLLFAVQNIWIKKYAAAHSNLVFTFLTNVMCLLGFILLLPILGMKIPPLTTFDFWLSAIGMGLLGTCAAYLFWNKGVQRLGAANAGLFINAVPLAAAIFAIFFGERLEMYHAVSGALILLGLFYVQRSGVN